ncbi:MAG TPA: CehA/McbA family metallohydrolase [Anaerolineaceae bacterium]
MEELIANLHMHTKYSDGSGNHADLAQAALQTDIDILFVTDHNIWVHGLDGYHQRGQKKILMLVGEEVHNASRNPQKSHLLVLEAGREMMMYAADPQRLIHQVNKAGGFSIIAHPIDPEMRFFGEDDISWDDWYVEDFNAIELWNGLSELKTVAHNWLEGFFYVFFPNAIARGPIPDTIKRWDALLSSGKRIVAVGGSDAHALQVKAGPIRKIVFPYRFHYRCINTHLLAANELTGDLQSDRQMVLEALHAGHAFIGYDLPASTRGFRFTAQGKAQGRAQLAIMGDELPLGDGATIQIRLPQKCECRLLKDGQVVKTWRDRDICTYNTNARGVYRVECYISYLGRRRGWIFSNPIYLR